MVKFIHNLHSLQACNSFYKVASNEYSMRRFIYISEKIKLDLVVNMIEYYNPVRSRSYGVELKTSSGDPDNLSSLLRCERIRDSD
jgi:hypothetical protein